MKAWSALRHNLGEATDLPELLERARCEDAEARRHARFGLRERLVSAGAWPSAAHRVVVELIMDVIDPDTPDLAGLLALLTDLAAADADRVRFRALESDDPTARHILEALDSRSYELADLTRHDEPAVRAHAIQLVSIAVFDAPLPESDEDPEVDATLAVARARCGLPWSGKPGLAHSLYRAWSTESLDPAALAAALCDPPSRAHFPWARDGFDAWMQALILELHSDPALLAAVFSEAVERCPKQRLDRIQIVAESGFSEGVEDPSALTEVQREWLRRVLSAPLPRGALGIRGLPERAEDARRMLGFDPPGLLEHSTPNGPVYTALTGVPSASGIRALGLSPAQNLELAGLTVDGPYWMSPVPTEVLAELIEQAGPAASRAWAEAFLAQLSQSGSERSAHANLALLALPASHRDRWADRLAFSDEPDRVQAVLSGLSAPVRRAAALAWLDDPTRPDFHEGKALSTLLPHLADDPELVGPVLGCVATVLAAVHHDAPLQATVRAVVAWAAKVDAEQLHRWRGSLSAAESGRLDEMA